MASIIDEVVKKSESEQKNPAAVALGRLGGQKWWPHKGTETNARATAGNSPKSGSGTMKTTDLLSHRNRHNGTFKDFC